MPSRFPSRYSYQFMRLQRQAPLGVRETVAGCQTRIVRLLRAVHGLQEKMFEFQLRIAFRIGPGLRIDQLQFVAAPELEFRAVLRAHRQPQPAGGASVPLVSTATMNPRPRSAATRTESSCSSGSPPVQTTKRPAAPRAGHAAPGADHAAATAAASASGVSNFPPPPPAGPAN